MKLPARSDSHDRDTKLGRGAASTLGATVLLGVLLLGLSTTVPIADAAKPAPPPPVYFDVNVLGEGSASDMNDFGTMVGRSHVNGHAFVYDLLDGAVDLNDVPGATLIDLIDLNNPSTSTPITAQTGSPSEQLALTTLDK